MRKINMRIIIMDSYRNKVLNSEVFGSKLSLNSLNHPVANNFEKLIQYVQEKYRQRLQSLEESAADFKHNCVSDLALLAMKENLITEKYMDQRIAELFQTHVIVENERTITILHNELAQKKSELLKSEQQIFTFKLEIEKYEDKYRLYSSREPNFSNRDNIRELFEKERAKSEYYEGEIERMSKDLNKTREIFQENEKLQRYCEQLEEERDKIQSSSNTNPDLNLMIAAQKQAGFETIKELQDKFKRKIKALKKKIVEQKTIIENFDQGSYNAAQKPEAKSFLNTERALNADELRVSFEKREFELLEKHKQQILNLQSQYKNLLDAKVKEIEEQINPRGEFGNISQEQYFDIVKRNNDLEKQLMHLQGVLKNSTGQDMNQSIELKKSLESYQKKNSELENSLFLLKTQQEITELRNKAPFNEKYESELTSHTETKFKLKRAEEDLSEMKLYIRDIEETNKQFKDSLAIKENQISKLKQSEQIGKLLHMKLGKLKNHTNLLKSQLKNLQIYVKETVNGLLNEYIIKFKESLVKLSSIVQSYPKINALRIENRNLCALLKNNSEAFDKLQEEVKIESSKMKASNHLVLENLIRENKLRHDREVEELKAQLQKSKEMNEKEGGSSQLDSHPTLQLMEEVENLRAEKEQFRRKLKVFEEKIDIQTNNFKTQLKNKQNEIELLKKAIIKN